jgi:threonine/homoserine/homoserine lactone efflux protein
VISAADLALFAAAALIMVLTPGPNMIYLVSRSICQGRAVGVISLFGVIAGFVAHRLATQRYVMGGVLAALAAMLALEESPQP